MNRVISDILSTLTRLPNKGMPVSGTIVLVGVPAISRDSKDSDIQPKAQTGSAAVQSHRQPSPKHLRRQCIAIRRDFLDYVKNLDRPLFAKACGKCRPGELAEAQKIIYNEVTDPAKVAATADIFKEHVNEAIMDEIVRLKSLMTVF